MVSLILSLLSLIGISGDTSSTKSAVTSDNQAHQDESGTHATTGSDQDMQMAGDDTHSGGAMGDGTGHDMGDGSGEDMADGSGHDMGHGSGHDMGHGSGHDMGSETPTFGGILSSLLELSGVNDDTPIVLPTTPEEIEAFVQDALTRPDTHSHNTNTSMANEHMAAMDLVAKADTTHIAIGNGSWFDPENWYQGMVPDDDAQVLIPEGVHLTYDAVSDTELFTVRVDGHLEFATDVDSQMIVDTLVITPSAKLTIGTEANPVEPHVDVDILFANNGPIDTDWDPMLLSRGMIAHGEVSIHGAEVDSHEKVTDDPMAGDTWIDFSAAPTGWQVGDTIVIAGTHYDGYKWDGAEVSHHLPEDEVRVISEIDGGRVHFEEALEFDHDSPREDLKTSVANYTRNVSFSTEDPESAEVYERGHVMFMHSDDVDVRYAEFHELGRTDKSETALNSSEFENISYDDNVKGRYAFHFHRAGVDDQEDPAMAVGNAVYGSPGWGFVHHDSNAILDNNASYNTFGAGFVAESGNETGEWTNNIAIYAQGVDWSIPKVGNDLANFDLGKTGDGFWFQGRMVTSIDNIAASVNTGFVYFHRGDHHDNANLKFDSSLFEFPDALFYSEGLTGDDVPVLSFDGNEAFAAHQGLHVVKAEPNQGHDIHSVFEDFTAWSVINGAVFEYTAHYLIKDFDLIGKEETEHSYPGSGITFGTNTSDMAIVDPEVEGFGVGIKLYKDLIGEWDDPSLHEYAVINPSFKDVDEDFRHYDPQLDQLLTSEELPNHTPDIVLDHPLTYKDDLNDPTGRMIDIAGTKFDSLGTTSLPSGTDNYDVGFHNVIKLLETDGYYQTSEGDNYFMLDMYFSDRVSGDIYLERHPVFLDEDVEVGNEHLHYRDAVFNGVQDLGGEGDPTIDAAVLWATLTDGQVVLSEYALDDELARLDELEEDVVH